MKARPRRNEMWRIMLEVKPTRTALIASSFILSIQDTEAGGSLATTVHCTAAQPGSKSLQWSLRSQVLQGSLAFFSASIRIYQLWFVIMWSLCSSPSTVTPAPPCYRPPQPGRWLNSQLGAETAIDCVLFYGQPWRCGVLRCSTTESNIDGRIQRPTNQTPGQSLRWPTSVLITV